MENIIFKELENEKTTVLFYSVNICFLTSFEELMLNSKEATGCSWHSKGVTNSEQHRRF